MQIFFFFLFFFFSLSLSFFHFTETERLGADGEWKCAGQKRREVADGSAVGPMEMTIDNHWFLVSKLASFVMEKKRAAIKVNDCLGPDTQLLSHRIQLFRRRPLQQLMEGPNSHFPLPLFFQCSHSFVHIFSNDQAGMSIAPIYHARWQLNVFLYH